MSFLIIDGERYALQLGENPLGGGGDGELPMPELAALPRFAVVCVWPDRPATIQRLVPHPPIVLDGSALGDEPRELRHGSRIEVAGRRILHGDLRTLGSTAHVAGVTDEDLALLAALARPEPTADTGGRLVALADGSFYPVPETGLEIGRDPACAVVLSSKAVSRRHAVVAPSLMGYTLTDLSANGVVVNGARVEGVHVLGQGDIIHIGPDGFRFEANSASFEPSASALAAEQIPLVGSDRPASATAPAAAVRTSAAAPPPRATLEVRAAGPLHGTRFRIERSPIRVGRAEHNDIVLPFESVSASHATLRWTGDGWVIADLDSTNGTYVGGARITGEQRLDGPADVSFGGAEALFETATEARQAPAVPGPVGGAPAAAGGTPPGRRGEQRGAPEATGRTAVAAIRRRGAGSKIAGRADPARLTCPAVLEGEPVAAAFVEQERVGVDEADEERARVHRRAEPDEQHAPAVGVVGARRDELVVGGEVHLPVAVRRLGTRHSALGTRRPRVPSGRASGLTPDGSPLTPRPWTRQRCRDARPARAEPVMAMPARPHRDPKNWSTPDT